MKGKTEIRGRLLKQGHARAEVEGRVEIARGTGDTRVRYRASEGTLGATRGSGSHAAAGTLKISVHTPEAITARGGDNYLEISPALALELSPVGRQMVGEINIDGRINVLRRRYEFQ